MKTGKIRLLIIVPAILIGACQNSQKRLNKIVKIEFAHEWPAGAISIDSSLTYNYFGGDFAKMKGYFKGKVSVSFWDTLNRKFEQIDFKNLDTASNLRIDAPASELIIHWKDHKLHLQKDLYDLPDSVSNTIFWLANSFKRIKLYPVKDTLHFNTTMQLPPYPPEILKDVKFLPPKL